MSQTNRTQPDNTELCIDTFYNYLFNVNFDTLVRRGYEFTQQIQKNVFFHATDVKLPTDTTQFEYTIRNMSPVNKIYYIARYSFDIIVNLIDKYDVNADDPHIAAIGFIMATGKSAGISPKIIREGIDRAEDDLLDHFEKVQQFEALLTLKAEQTKVM